MEPLRSPTPPVHPTPPRQESGKRRQSGPEPLLPSFFSNHVAPNPAPQTDSPLLISRVNPKKRKEPPKEPPVEVEIIHSDENRIERVFIPRTDPSLYQPTELERFLSFLDEEGVSLATLSSRFSFEDLQLNNPFFVMALALKALFLQPVFNQNRLERLIQWIALLIKINHPETTLFHHVILKILRALAIKHELPLNGLKSFSAIGNPYLSRITFVDMERPFVSREEQCCLFLKAVVPLLPKRGTPNIRETEVLLREYLNAVANDKAKMAIWDSIPYLDYLHTLIPDGAIMSSDIWNAIVSELVKPSPLQRRLHVLAIIWAARGNFSFTKGSFPIFDFYGFYLRKVGMDNVLILFDSSSTKEILPYLKKIPNLHMATPGTPQGILLRALTCLQLGLHTSGLLYLKDASLHITTLEDPFYGQFISAYMMSEIPKFPLKDWNALLNWYFDLLSSLKNKSAFFILFYTLIPVIFTTYKGKIPIHWKGDKFRQLLLELANLKGQLKVPFYTLTAPLLDAWAVFPSNLFADGIAAMLKRVTPEDLRADHDDRQFWDVIERMAQRKEFAQFWPRITTFIEQYCQNQASAPFFQCLNAVATLHPELRLSAVARRLLTNKLLNIIPKASLHLFPGLVHFLVGELNEKVMAEFVDSLKQKIHELDFEKLKIILENLKILKSKGYLKDSVFNSFIYLLHESRLTQDQKNTLERLVFNPMSIHNLIN